MIHRFFVGLIRLFKAAPFLALSFTAANLLAAEKTLLVYGDSLSAAYGLTDINRGWVQLLQDKINRQKYPWKVVNVSISGETTAGGLSRLEKVLKTTQPNLVLLELGANDGLQGRPLQTLKSNLDKMISLLREYKCDVILFEMKIPPNYGPVYTQRFTQTFQDLGAKWEIPVLPFFLAGVAGNDALNQPDGIHPTQQAQPIILQNVWPVLKDRLTP